MHKTQLFVVRITLNSILILSVPQSTTTVAYWQLEWTLHKWLTAAGALHSLHFLFNTALFSPPVISISIPLNWILILSAHQPASKHCCLSATGMVPQVAHSSWSATHCTFYSCQYCTILVSHHLVSTLISLWSIVAYRQLEWTLHKWLRFHSSWSATQLCRLSILIPLSL